MKLRPEDIQFHSASVVDGAGRLFWYDGSLYRAIQDRYSPFYKDLFQTKRIEELFPNGLIQTSPAPVSLDGYNFVLKHRRIPFVSYCVEWTAAMLKDAALLLCDLSLDLFERGLTLKDAHPWNILFDEGSPYFVDWGSIAALDEHTDWPYLEFRDRFIFPLLLLAAGQSTLVRNLMLDVVHRASRGDVFRLLLGRISLPGWLQSYWDDKTLARASRKQSPKFFADLRQKIQSIPVEGVKTEWSSYDGPTEDLSATSPDAWPDKMRNVHDLLIRMKPSTVLDIGCNRGWFSDLAFREGAKVISMDLDEPSLTHLYHRVRKEHISILPVLMDICLPTPAYGINQGYDSARDRFQVDLVMALAVTHHLVFKRELMFDTLVSQFAAFTRKWLIVEFVPPEDQYVQPWMKERFQWYHQDGFRKALEKFFPRIEVIHSSPSPRLLFWCER